MSYYRTLINHLSLNNWGYNNIHEKSTKNIPEMPHIIRNWRAPPVTPTAPSVRHMAARNILTLVEGDRERRKDAERISVRTREI